MNIDAANSRRSFLKLGVAAVAGLSVSSALLAADAAPAAAKDDEFGGLPVGIQSYTLRDRSFDKMLEAMNELGLREVELFPGHLAGLTPPKAMEKLKAAGVTAVSYGVVPFSANHDENRKLFEYAKTFGMKNISCDPSEDSFDSLDKLTEEYNITAAIHPHGPGSRWVKIDQMYDAVKNHSKKIGLNNETGWLIAADEDPVRACEVFKDRMHAMHLKDFKKKEGGGLEDVPAGEGQLKIDELVKAMLDMKFNGVMSVEYEGGEPVAAVKKSMQRIKEAVRKAKQA